MEKNSSYDDLIEKYLDGTLSDVERELFDERLKTDTILSKKLSDRLMIQKSWIKVAQRSQVKQHINRLISIEKQDQKWRRNTWLVAASLSLLIGISSLLFLRHNQYLNDREFLAKSKSNNKDKSDKIVQGQQNEIKKYASIDSLNINKTVSGKQYLPTDGAIYQVTDTIVFIWPGTLLKERLVIFDERGTKVAEVPLQTGDIEHKLLPLTLKPGSYTWNITPNELNYKFIIKK